MRENREGIGGEVMRGGLDTNTYMHVYLLLLYLLSIYYINI